MTRRQLELDDEFRAAGRTAILGLGSAPGKTNLLARLAAERVGGKPVAMEIWAATRDPAADGHPFPAPYSVRTLLDELRMSPMVVRDGELQDAEPLSGQAAQDVPGAGRREGGHLHAALRARDPARALSEPRGGELPALPRSRADREAARAPRGRGARALHAVERLGLGARGRGPKRRRSHGRRHLADARWQRPLDLGAAGPRRGRAARRPASPRRAPTPPEDAIPDAEAFLAALDTELTWS